MKNLNSSIGKSFKKPKEAFSFKKFGKGLDLLDPISWAKLVSFGWKLLIIPLFIAGILYFTQQEVLAYIVLASSLILLVIGTAMRNRAIINIGMIIIAVAGVLFFYGMYQGYKKAPLIVNVPDGIYENNGCKLVVKDGKTYLEGKQLKISEKQELLDIGFSMKPSLFFAALKEQPIGLGLEVFNIGKWNLDTMWFPITTVGVGVSHDIVNFPFIKHMDISAGIGATRDIRTKVNSGIFYFKLAF